MDIGSGPGDIDYDDESAMSDDENSDHTPTSQARRSYTDMPTSESFDTRRTSTTAACSEPRSASLPARSPLKSALHSPKLDTPPAYGTPKQQKKSARFNDALLEINDAIRRAATEPTASAASRPIIMWEPQKASSPLTETGLPRAWSGTSDGLFVSRQTPDDYEDEDDKRSRNDTAEEDDDCYEYQREAIAKSYGAVDRRASLADASVAAVEDDDSQISGTPSYEDTAAAQAGDNDAGEQTGSVMSESDAENRDSSSTSSGNSSANEDNELPGYEHQPSLREMSASPFPELEVEPGIEEVNTNEMNNSRPVQMHDHRAIGSVTPVDNIFECSECTQHHVQEWSGELTEMPRIMESPEDSISEETQSVPTLKAAVIAPVRRSSYNGAEKPTRGRRMTKTDDHRRYSSLTELCRLKGRVKSPSVLSMKSSPAPAAVTAVTVRPAESPRLNTVYEHPSERYRPMPPPKEPVRTAHTVQSDLGTYQMLWEEPAPSSSSSTVTVFADAESGVEVVVTDDTGSQIIAPPSPRMEKVKTKLRAWSWERELGDEQSEERPG